MIKIESFCRPFYDLFSFVSLEILAELKSWQQEIFHYLFFSFFVKSLRDMFFTIISHYRPCMILRLVQIDTYGVFLTSAIVSSSFLSTSLYYNSVHNSVTA